MGPIQSGINQSLAILSMAASQDPAWKQTREGNTSIKLGKHKVAAATAAYNKNKSLDAAVALGPEKIAGLEAQREGYNKLGNYEEATRINEEIVKSRERLQNNEATQYFRDSLDEDDKRMAEMDIQMESNAQKKQKEAEMNALSSLKAKSSSRARQKERLNLMRNNVKDRAVQKQNKLNDIRARQDIRIGKEDSRNV